MRVGLSPHARGNPSAPRSLPGPTRSIPARAGQPRTPCLPRIGQGVYPRTRGATPVKAVSQSIAAGLSPHARGNRLEMRSPRHRQGSIPARAGQPIIGRHNPTNQGVYPRTRGATVVRPPPQSLGRGLSPHARGNPDRNTSHDPLKGSIPARAGQPATDSRSR